MVKMDGEKKKGVRKEDVGLVRKDKVQLQKRGKCKRG